MAWLVILHSFIHDAGWIVVPIVTVAPTVKAGFMYHCLKCRSNLLWIYIFFIYYMVKIFSLIFIWIYMWICLRFHSSLDLRRSTLEGFKWIPSRVSHYEHIKLKLSMARLFSTLPLTAPLMMIILG